MPVSSAPCDNNRYKKLIAQGNAKEALRNFLTKRKMELERVDDGKWRCEPRPMRRKRADLSNLDGDLEELNDKLCLPTKTVEVFFAYTAMLRECLEHRFLREAERIYAQMREHRMVCRSASHTLMQLYMQRGMVDEAAAMFRGIGDKSVVSYSLMISAYAQNGHPLRAMQEFRAMPLSPTREVLVAALQACGSGRLIEDGRKIHWRVGKRKDVVLQNAILSMYVSCGDLNSAHKLFAGTMEKLRDAASWEIIVCGFLDNGFKTEGMKHFRLMLHEKGELVPKNKTVLAVLAACSDISEAKSIHSLLVSCERVQLQQVPFRVALIEMYARCGSLDDALQVFNRGNTMKNTTAVWNTMLRACTQSGQSKQAMELFQRMQPPPNGATFSILLAACGDASEGQQLHEQIVQGDVQVDAALEQAILDMYSRCGVGAERAKELFDSVQASNACVEKWSFPLASPELPTVIG